MVVDDDLSDVRAALDPSDGNLRKESVGSPPLAATTLCSALTSNDR